MADNILDIMDLSVRFTGPTGPVDAVSGVSLCVRRGEVFGLVGESGSGKTLTALSVLKLVPIPGRITGGRILFGGADVLSMNEDELRSLRGSKIAMVFQEPASSFNPVFTIGYQIAESIIVHRGPGSSDAKKAVLKGLEDVHIPDPERVYHCYPHQLSGGTKQRAMIAMSLANSPELLILDEPTTALDVTIQAQILELIKEVISKNGMSALFISHDFGVVASMADRVGVMNKGKIVETGEVAQILNAPKDRYTASLIGSVKALG